MSRYRFLLAGALIAVVLLAACSASAAAPSPSPSGPPAGPSAAPSVTPLPSASPLPSVTPLAPTDAPPAVSPPAQTQAPGAGTPRPTAAGFTAAEQDLLDGVQRGSTDCQPVRGGALPADAVAGIECDSTAPGVARMGFYRFADDEAMIAAYLARMEAEGVALETGLCFDGAAEHAYVPNEGFALERAGCFVNDEGFGNYRYTLPGEHLYVGLLGQSDDLQVLELFAWKGNSDTPGVPTLWFGGID